MKKMNCDGPRNFCLTIKFNKITSSCTIEHYNNYLQFFLDFTLLIYVWHQACNPC